MTLPKTFDPAEIEATHYAHWEASGLMACNPASAKPPFCMMMPPPNVTGSLHMGHAFQDTLMDILTRYHRMKGFDTLWQPGMDHAGIATQMIVERTLEGQGLYRKQMGREAFVKKVWEWKVQSGGQIVHQLRRLGVTPDWARERFTLDEGLSAAVRKAFVQLYRDGLIYKDKRLVNWDPKLQTAISDLEVYPREVKGHMWHIAYPIESGGTIMVATTRPETMLGDTAVAVHPQDDRYKDIVGKYVVLPITGRRIPIIADVYADPEQGSGAVKITPAHDFKDFEVGRRHDLPLINIFDGRAHLNDNVPAEYRGLDRFKAREKVLEVLDVVRVEEIVHTVPYDEKSKTTVIEPYLTDQWYVDAGKLAGPALQAVKDGRTKFFPSQWENTYARWLEDIKPWCISRQLWWGHQIPVWYGPDGAVYVAQTLEEAQTQAGQGVRLTQDPDVLDMWFSSGLWPFATLGWPQDTVEMGRYYPTNVLVTAFDIIFFWVARMMMLGLHLTGDVPFRKVYMHAIVRDAAGQKMSKTRGNVMDPLELCDKYGADALRFTLAAMAAPGRDVRLAEARVAGYRNFATKLWNAARYCEMNGITLCNAPDESSEMSFWILGELNSIREDIEEAIESYQFNAAAEILYHFVWGTFCDLYLEFTKDIPDPMTTGFVLGEILKLLNPFMPFITEEIYHHMGGVGLLAAQDWPVPRAQDHKSLSAASRVLTLRDCIFSLRSLRKDINISDSARPDLYIDTQDQALAKSLQDHAKIIIRMARLKSLTCASLPKGAMPIVVNGATLGLMVEGLDLTKTTDRLMKETIELRNTIKNLNMKLDNMNFTENARPEIVEEYRTRSAVAWDRCVRLESILESLK